MCSKENSSLSGNRAVPLSTSLEEKKEKGGLSASDQVIESKLTQADTHPPPLVAKSFVCAIASYKYKA